MEKILPQQIKKYSKKFILKQNFNEVNEPNAKTVFCCGSSETIAVNLK